MANPCDRKGALAPLQGAQRLCCRHGISAGLLNRGLNTWKHISYTRDLKAGEIFGFEASENNHLET